MVLKVRMAGGSPGVTLIELLIAISLSTVVIGLALALFKDAGLAARLGDSRREAAAQAQAVFISLSTNLMTGGGILRLAPGNLRILNARQRPMEYRWEDSVLISNGKTWNFRLASLEVRPFGPKRPERQDFTGGGEWDLDSLDGNRDGSIDFDELDRDRNGELDPEESRYVAVFEISMTIIQRGLPFTQNCKVHPRNRVPSSGNQDFSDAAGKDGIFDP
ncbi:MAG: prepilin-type N-terminal cleavage/methylation domain-containing protein [Fibrobacteria bacterium]